MNGRPKNYMPISTFEEGGYRFEGWQPRNANAPREMLIRIFKADELLREERVEMFYPNRFGLDGEDLNRLDAKTSEIIRELGIQEEKPA